MKPLLKPSKMKDCDSGSESTEKEQHVKIPKTKRKPLLKP